MSIRMMKTPFFYVHGKLWFVIRKLYISLTYFILKCWGNRSSFIKLISYFFSKVNWYLSRRRSKTLHWKRCRQAAKGYRTKKYPEISYWSRALPYLFFPIHFNITSIFLIHRKRVSACEVLKKNFLTRIDVINNKRAIRLIWLMDYNNNDSH